jgi:peptidoglycan/xylan/chitin deacetylase (PgdA/CDA1 family)
MKAIITYSSQLKYKAKSTMLFLMSFITLVSSNVSAQNTKIALLYPQFTISLPAENSNWIKDNFYRWELFMMMNKYKYDVLKDSDLDDDLSSEYSLLIIPAARSLGEKEIQSIKNFMANGNSVIATWGLGVYDLEGKWKGWENIEQLFGVSYSSEITQQESSRIHSLFGGTPISSKIPPGFRLQITTFDKPIEVKINSPKTFPLGYWLDNEIPFEGKNKSDYTTSAVYGGFGKGKFVWFGFEFSAVVGTKMHQANANQLLNNAIQWLNDDLIVQIETWPDGKKAAAVLSCDVEFKFSYINNALDFLETENLPAQFYILTESIDNSSFERLKKIGDIGLHGDNHVLFKWQNYRTQLERLSNGIGVLEKLNNKKPLSFRPPETFYDNITLDVMDSLNFKVLSSDFVEDRSVPQFLEGHPNILIIPKTGFDDFDVFQRLKIEDVGLQANRYLLDFNRTYDEGGLYSLNFHTQMQCREEFVNALIEPISDFKSKDVWITTHDQVYNWWMKKNKIKISKSSIDEKNYLIEIINEGDQEIEHLSLSLYKKSFVLPNDLLIMLNGQELSCTTDYINQKIKVVLPRIFAKETIKLNVRM